MAKDHGPGQDHVDEVIANVDLALEESLGPENAADPEDIETIKQFFEISFQFLYTQIVKI